MPVQACPACNRPTPRLGDSPDDRTLVDYYHCSECGHVWTTSKADGSIDTHITPLTKTKKTESPNR